MPEINLVLLGEYEDVINKIEVLHFFVWLVWAHNVLVFSTLVKLGKCIFTELAVVNDLIEGFLSK